ncbi:MAG: terminase family protein [Bryobacteraceae bacterium]|nr:terminase family protein [Bryobacteraceae bacterium]
MSTLIWDRPEGGGRGVQARPLSARLAADLYRDDVVRFARERLGFEPDALQEEVLRSGDRVLLCCSRQWGKTTVTAIKALHMAMYVPRSLVLVASPSERQSRLFLRVVRTLAFQLGLGLLKGDGDNRSSVQFPGGGRIVGLPGRPDTVVGFSGVSLLIFDEAARVSDEIFEVLNPVLAVSGGALWCMSTPKGKRGFFYTIWKRGAGDEWVRIAVPATECARIPAAFLERQKRDLPDRKFRQEYMCEFLEPEGAVFTEAMLANLFTDAVKPLDY